MKKPYWIIEHPTRGVYVGTEPYGNGIDWDKPRPRFRWSIPRNEGMIFYSSEEAYRVWIKFPPALQQKSYVMRLGNPDHEPVIEFR